jgi:RNA polymerase sigma-70 factor (ECF subfamily)
VTGLEISVSELPSDAFLPDEESLWIIDAQRGDREAFARLIQAYWDRLYRWLVHLTHDAHAAEDLAQETFLKAYANLDSFRAGSNFRAWLYRIAHNNFINQRRGRRGNRQSLSVDWPSQAEGPVEATLNREALLQLTLAVGRLPTDFRSAFLLRVEEGLSFKQIAEVMGITEQTARWRVFKARQKLLQVMSPELFPPASEPEPRPNTP